MVDRKKKLIDLGAAELADALLDLAVRIEAADDLVERLIATPTENIKRFKKKMTSLKRSKRFIRWGASSKLSNELETLLQDLKAGVSDPLTGVELIASFYETDKGTLGHCDDSSGIVGNVYRFTAQELFIEYASHCDEKKKITKILLKLNKKDDYGVRDTLIDCVNEYLPESDIRFMISEFQKLGEREKDEYEKRHWFRLIESLARQIKDAPLFEKTRIKSWGKTPTAACIDISRVYLESGDIQTALSWIEKISKDETFQAYERDQILIEIYKQLGNDKKLTKILFKKFSSYRSIETLQELLNVIGDDKKDEVLINEVSTILAQKNLKESDAKFLITIKKIDDAEKYILERAEQLNGNYYDSLLPLAKTMDSENRPLATSMIYRSLLNSILKRGYTKAYPHGVRYLRILDRLANSIIDWKNFENHELFKDQVHQKHGLKRSFWSKYESQ